MIGRLILLIAFLIAVLTLITWLKKTPKSQLKGLYWKLGLSLAAMILILLAATGRVHWVSAVIGALLPFARKALPIAIRFFPLLQHLHKIRPKPQPKTGNSSQVHTSVLAMTLDHDSNRLSGEVINGPFAGQTLDSLDLEQLQTVLEYCQQQDQDSVKLLVSYLNHRFGHHWQKKPPPNSGEQPMNVHSALAILGLKKGASKQEVIKAHRKMMQKMHPDHGGSDYLAAQINAAKDLLIKHLT